MILLKVTSRSEQGKHERGDSRTQAEELSVRVMRNDADASPGMLVNKKRMCGLVAERFA